MASQDARFDLDLREMNRPGPSYTIDTIRSIKSDRINSTLFLLVGADSYIDFPRWKDASTIRSLTQLVVYQRDTHSGQHSEFELQHGDILLNGAPLLGSSTEIRETRAKNNRIDQWVTPEVAAYIKANELYLAD